MKQRTYPYRTVAQTIAAKARCLPEAILADAFAWESGQCTGLWNSERGRYFRDTLPNGQPWLQHALRHSSFTRIVAESKEFMAVLPQTTEGKLIPTPCPTIWVLAKHRLRMNALTLTVHDLPWLRRMVLFTRETLRSGDVGRSLLGTEDEGDDEDMEVEEGQDQLVPMCTVELWPLMKTPMLCVLGTLQPQELQCDFSAPEWQHMAPVEHILAWLTAEAKGRGLPPKDRFW